MEQRGKYRRCMPLSVLCTECGGNRIDEYEKGYCYYFCLDCNEEVKLQHEDSRRAA